MINQKFENLIQRMKDVKLSSEEKSDIRSRVFSIIEQIEAVTSTPSTYRQSVATPYESITWSLYINNRKFVPSLVIVALLFVTGGASLAAEGALPGDSLYSLKINVNEEVRDLTAVTPESRARVAVEATERRLQEAATLSARGKLNDQTKSIVQNEFKKHAVEVKSRVASLVSTNNLTAAQEVAVNYESSLRAHEIILEKISSDQVDRTTQHLSSFIDTLKTEIATSTVSRVDIQVKEIKATVDPKTSAENKLKEVRTQTENVINLRVQNIAKLSTTTAALVAGRIAEAQVLTIKAQGFLASSSPSEALIVIQKASTVLSDAEGSISVEIGLDNDVKKAIGIGASDSSTNGTSTATTTISIEGASSGASSSTVSVGTTTVFLS